MIINDSKKLSSVQQEFHELFPGLKIEFYKKSHGAKKGSTAEDQLNPELSIGDARTVKTEGDMVIDPEMTVAEFEKTFEENFGLHVQVFRRSADLWLQTTATDGWTLSVQNRKGIHSMEAISE